VDWIDLGWNAHFQAHFDALENAADLCPARVARQDRGSYVLYAPGRAWRGVPAGALRRRAADRAEWPAVGDWVVAAADGCGTARIERVLPRTSVFSRRAAGENGDEQIVAANIDRLLICCGVDRDFNLRRIERYVMLARRGGAAPTLVLTKADLAADSAEKQISAAALAPDAECFLVSVVDGRGLEELRGAIGRGTSAALVGSSGVGKSSIINALLGASSAAVGEVRADDGRGRHTTTRREIHLLAGGGVLIDTPGMRELQLLGDADDVASAFGEIELLAPNCRFRDCRHETEPGCAVLAAAADGTLSPQRLESYRKQLRELAFHARRDDPAAQSAERARWKSLHKSARRWMKQKYGDE
jgi:ribosome biogenesis GTPase / thiamine phosphate phosphatase